MLVEIHKASDEMIETIRKTGQIRRSTKTTQESISVEKDKKVEVKLAKLKSDLDHIKNENARLRKSAANWTCVVNTPCVFDCCKYQENSCQVMTVVFKPMWCKESKNMT